MLDEEACAPGGDDAGAACSVSSPLLPDRAGLHRLPDDMKDELLSFLPARDLLSLASASRADKVAVQGAATTWHALLTVDFGMPADAFHDKFHYARAPAPTGTGTGTAGSGAAAAAAAAAGSGGLPGRPPPVQRQPSTSAVMRAPYNEYKRRFERRAAEVKSRVERRRVEAQRELITRRSRWTSEYYWFAAVPLHIVRTLPEGHFMRLVLAVRLAAVLAVVLAHVAVAGMREHVLPVVARGTVVWAGFVFDLACYAVPVALVVAGMAGPWRGAQRAWRVAVFMLGLCLLSASVAGEWRWRERPSALPATLWFLLRTAVPLLLWAGVCLLVVMLKDVVVMLIARVGCIARRCLSPMAMRRLSHPPAYKLVLATLIGAAVVYGYGRFVYWVGLDRPPRPVLLQVAFMVRLVSQGAAWWSAVYTAVSIRRLRAAAATAPATTRASFLASLMQIAPHAPGRHWHVQALLRLGLLAAWVAAFDAFKVWYVGDMRAHPSILGVGWLFGQGAGATFVQCVRVLLMAICFVGVPWYAVLVNAKLRWEVQSAVRGEAPTELASTRSRPPNAPLGNITAIATGLMVLAYAIVAGTEALASSMDLPAAHESVNAVIYSQ